jgi:hypothetical protein
MSSLTAASRCWPTRPAGTALPSAGGAVVGGAEGDEEALAEGRVPAAAGVCGSDPESRTYARIATSATTAAPSTQTTRLAPDRPRRAAAVERRVVSAGRSAGGEAAGIFAVLSVGSAAGLLARSAAEAAG